VAFPSRSAAQRSAPAERFKTSTVFILFSPRNLLCRETNRVRSRAAPKPTPIMCSAIVQNSTAATAREQRGNPPPFSVHASSRPSFFPSTLPAYSYGDTMHGVGRMPAGLSAARFTAIKSMAIYFQYRRIASTIYCNILSEGSPSRQIVETRIRIIILQTPSWR
jgi:hypothetical protein